MQESTPSPITSGRRPYISEEAVRDALRSLLYHDPDVPLVPNPLWQLTIVDLMLHDPTIPRADKPRHRLLNYILIELIEENALRVREQCDVPPLTSMSSLQDILTDLRQIAGHKSAELKAWTLLYARYVTIAAGVDAFAAAEALGVDERHCRRLHAHGIKRLVEQLVDREWAARQQNRRYRLLARIPGETRSQPFGREDWLQRAHALMREEGQKLLVTGDAGIGKKTVVRALLRIMIDNDEIDHLLWLEKPAAADAVMLWLQESMSLESAHRFDLDLFLDTTRFILVISDLEHLAKDADALDQLLGRLKRARVILIHRGHLSLAAVSAELLVPPLDSAALEAYFVQCWRRFQDPDAISDIDSQQFLLRSSGSPALLKRLVQEHGYDATSATIVTEQLAEAIAVVSVPSRELIVAQLLSTDDGLTPADFAATWGERYTTDHMRELLALHILERDTSSGKIAVAAHWSRRLQDDCRAKGWTHARVSELLPILDAGLRGGNDVSSRVVETLLRADWLHLSEERAALWLSLGWRFAIERGSWAGWLYLLRNATEGGTASDALTWLGRGVCARYATSILESSRALQMAISIAGETGSFAVQTEALLERGILLRMCGRLGTAVDELGVVERKARQYGLTQLLGRVYLEQAQLALERGDGGQMLAILEPLPATALVTLLRAEAYALLGELRTGLSVAEHLDPHVRADRSLCARLHTLRGRIHRSMLDHAVARREYETAVTLLERSDDLFSRARAYANLGTAVLEAGGEREEALDLYRRAEVLQRQTGDILALYATSHNRDAAELNDPIV